MERDNILDADLKGVTVKIAWQFLIGWTTLLVSGCFAFWSLRAQLTEYSLMQGRTDAIQDMRLEGIKRDIDLQTLQIKDLNERYNELKARDSQLNK